MRIVCLNVDVSCVSFCFGIRNKYKRIICVFGVLNSVPVSFGEMEAHQTRLIIGYQNFMMKRILCNARDSMLANIVHLTEMG